MRKKRTKREGLLSRLRARRELKPRKWKPAYRIAQIDIRDVFLEAEHNKAEEERIAKLITEREAKNSEK